MKLVAVIRGAHTSDQTYKATAFELAKGRHRQGARWKCKEAPAVFVVNQDSAHPTINEGIDLV